MRGRLSALSVLSAVAFLLAGCMFIPPEEEVPEVISLNGRTLVWSDEFDTPGSGNAPDSAKWSYQTGGGGWGNNEVQTYTDGRANSFVEGGMLNVRAVKANGSWTSARLRSIGKGDWTYGYMEARLRVPAALGSWPAFWMMPTDSAYGGWPRSGEIDIMEYSPRTSGDKVYGTVHYGESHQYTSIGEKNDSGASEGFHRYGVEWTADSISWYLDGVKLGVPYTRHGDWRSWPYDKDFHFILNVAMGGNLGGSIDSALSEAVMQVDYVRVYQ